MNQVTKKINILEKPTFDLVKFEVIGEQKSEKIIFCQSQEVFRFDKCKGNLENRSRVLRLEKQESQLIVQIISATIDANFCGKLVWKIALTELGFASFEMDKNNFQTKIKNSVQIDLFKFDNNYYNGSNQTKLQADIIFFA
jgi:hypothetical protein